MCFTRLLWLHTQSPEQWQCQHSHSQLVFLEYPLLLIHILFPVLSPFISLLHFHLCWPIPFWLSILQNVIWIHHWETRRQHNYMGCCLCIKWRRDAQWSIPDRLWNKWCDCHSSQCTCIIYVLIHALRSQQQGLYLMQLLTVNTPW